jgi:hypothetical protein
LSLVEIHAVRAGVPVAVAHVIGAVRVAAVVPLPVVVVRLVDVPVVAEKVAVVMGAETIAEMIAAQEVVRIRARYLSRLSR